MTFSSARSRAVVLSVVVAVSALAGVVVAAPVSSFAATVDGSWRLVEQSPGKGRTEHAAGTPDLRLVLSRAGGDVRGEVWIAGREPVRAAWPALFDDDRPTLVRVIERTVSEAGDRVIARYEARDPADESRTLEITEDYRVTEDGSALVGRVTVRLRQGERSAGEYVLRRRFEREH